MKVKSIKNLEKFQISTSNLSTVKGGIDAWDSPLIGGSKPMRPNTLAAMDFILFP